MAQSEAKLLRRIQRLRQRDGVRKSSLAGLLGVSRTTLWRLEKGRNLDKHLARHLDARLSLLESTK